jgi:hypothetical protein
MLAGPRQINAGKFLGKLGVEPFYICNRARLPQAVSRHTYLAVLID